jgi:hypothetical protein
MDLEKYAADPYGYCAKELNISTERFRAYLDYVAGMGHCTGTTKSGKPCGNCGENHPDPSKFVPGISDRCAHHIELAST